MLSRTEVRDFRICKNLEIVIETIAKSDGNLYFSSLENFIKKLMLLAPKMVPESTQGPPQTLPKWRQVEKTKRKIGILQDNSFSELFRCCSGWPMLHQKWESRD